MTPPRTRTAAALAALLLVASACSLGEKEEWAETVRNLREEASAATTARVALTVEARGIEITGRSEPEALFSELAGEADFAAQTARLDVRAPKERRGTTLYFDDLAFYLPRSEASEGAQRWGRMDFTVEPEDDIATRDVNESIGLGMVGPSAAMLFLEGMLTGSIERVTSEELDETQTAHYRGRFSRDQAARDIEEEERREGLLRLLEVMGVSADLIDADVWVGVDGLPRRFILHLEQRLDRNNLFGLTLTYDLSDFGSDVDVELPDPEDTLIPPRFSEFVLDYLRVSV